MGAEYLRNERTRRARDKRPAAYCQRFTKMRTYRAIGASGRLPRRHPIDSPREQSSMKVLRLVGALLAAVALMSPPAASQSSGTVDLGVFARLNSLDASYSTATGGGGGFRAGYFFWKNLELNFDLSQSTNSSNVGQPGRHDVSAVASARRVLLPDGRQLVAAGGRRLWARDVPAERHERIRQRDRLHPRHARDARDSRVRDDRLHGRLLHQPRRQERADQDTH